MQIQEFVEQGAAAVAAGASLRDSVNRSTWERESCLQRSTVKLQQVIGPGAARPVTGTFERLERSDEALPTLKQNAGRASILFFCNHWDDLDEIKKQLGEAYVLGSPRGGGAFDRHTMSGGLTPDITLGEPSGELTARIGQIARLFAQANFKPRIERDIICWLYVSFAQNCAMVGASAKARGYQNLAADPTAVRDLYEAAREALAIVRARDFNPAAVRQAKPFYYIPKWLFVPLFKRLATRAEILAMADGHTQYAPAETKCIYYDLLNTAERLEIETPTLSRYKPFIDKL